MNASRKPSTEFTPPPAKLTSPPVKDTRSLQERKDDIFKALLASRVYGDASSHSKGMERVFEMFNKYFEEN
ncbi:hypothetical protein [Providencia phage PSTCR5]|uniref:Uncharacterized protein n=1 Tax=Providencia phage PSTCR5 TaxID=2783547 RepID=A0A873WSC1_9CAUD|nr:hypothetical protein KNV68_gp120 [Providencia phage PSTCR5]QPB12238.1 hypothetical protein [Providencia phage PSTCR5]